AEACVAVFGRAHGERRASGVRRAAPLRWFLPYKRVSPHSRERCQLQRASRAASERRKLPSVSSTGRCNTILAGGAAMSGNGLTAEQEAELLRRYKADECLIKTARWLQQPYGTLYTRIAVRGGCAPSERRRHKRVLSLAEREEISRGLSAGSSLRHIARSLGRAASSISREVRRHGGREYRALEADRRAWRSAERPKPCKLARQARVCSVVAQQLRAGRAAETN